MLLDNQAGVPAMLFRAIIDEERFAAAVIARVTYRIEGARLTFDEEQPWIVSGPSWDGPEGKMPSDEVFYRGGVDLFVFGSARPPGGRLVEVMTVRVRCGADFETSVVVVGDRVWQKRGGEIVPSAIEKFTSMPLTLAHAFGGQASWDGLPFPFPYNPEGKGFCVEAGDVEGRALPNIEDPDHLVKRWDDRPDPVGVGLCPKEFGPRVREAVKFREDGALTELKPLLFNAAFPRMVVPKVAPGERLRVDGVSPDGPIEIEIPALPLVTTLRIGGTCVERPLEVDQIGIQADQGRAFITYRYPFRYVMRRREKRSCVLALRGGA
jgi:hypothetical protein